MKSILFIFLFFLFFLNTSPVFAQGTFTCEWYISPSGVGNKCQVDDNSINCEPNYVPDDEECSNKDRSICSKDNYPCIPVGAVECSSYEECQKDGITLCSCPDGETCQNQEISAIGQQTGYYYEYRCVEEEKKESITLLQPKCCNIDTGLPVNDCSIFENSELEKRKAGIITALGCFPTHPQAIIDWILKYSIMFSGGIGFLLMLWASIQIMTSAGDPEKLKAGQELLNSAIIGILLIVFSLFILKFIGATVLKIPGWQ